MAFSNVNLNFIWKYQSNSNGFTISAVNTSMYSEELVL